MKPYRPGSSEPRWARRGILRKLELLEGRTRPAPARSGRAAGPLGALVPGAPQGRRALSDYEKKAVTVEGPFLSAFKPFTRDLFRTLSNTQNIRVDEERIENVAEFRVAGRWTGRLNILEAWSSGGAAARTRSPGGLHSSSHPSSSRLGTGRRSPCRSDSPSCWENCHQGWLLTTYGRDVRVGRGTRGPSLWQSG